MKILMLFNILTGALSFTSSAISHRSQLKLNKVQSLNSGMNEKVTAFQALVKLEQILKAARQMTAKNDRFRQRKNRLAYFRRFHQKNKPSHWFLQLFRKIGAMSDILAYIILYESYKLNHILYFLIFLSPTKNSWSTRDIASLALLRHVTLPSHHFEKTATPFFPKMCHFTMTLFCRSDAFFVKWRF